MNNILSICNPQQTNINILVHITDLCNYRCWYCYNKHRRHQLLSLDYNVLANYLHYVSNTTHRHIDLDLIGGEPSCYKNIIDLCKSVQNICNVCIYTNFSCNIDLYNDLASLGVKFDITYHSIDEIKQNNDVINNICNIDKSHIRGINIMLDPKTFNQSIQVFYQLKDGFPNIDVDVQQVICGNVVYNYTPEQIETYNRISQELDDFRYFQVCTTGGIVYATHNELYRMTKQKFKYWLCNAGKDLLYIHADGNVYNCDGYYNFNKSPLFNIYKQFSYPNRKTLCMVDDCPFQDNVFKMKVFKHEI